MCIHMWLWQTFHATDTVEQRGMYSADTAGHGEGRLRSAGVAAHGGAGQELARDSLLTGELLPGPAAGPDVPCIESGPTLLRQRCLRFGEGALFRLRPGLPDAQLQRAPRWVEV